ncbi:MAG TPA: hypothetical protein VF316_18420 [Polyangiaceae bacterium]
MAPAGSKNTPEAKARVEIDLQLEQAGWLLQDRDDMNLSAGSAIAVREFKLRQGHGYVDSRDAGQEGRAPRRREGAPDGRAPGARGREPRRGVTAPLWHESSIRDPLATA